MKPNNSRQVITAKQERATEEDILSQFFIQIQLRNQANCQQTFNLKDYYVAITSHPLSGFEDKM